ncbi:hypothetical protein C8R44DRAFT_741196 [Mycena epipterygia]|nr:hypothetical protein C8R44DRAFT_741196 [Mycena epipterygia]
MKCRVAPLIRLRNETPRSLSFGITEAAGIAEPQERMRRLLEEKEEGEDKLLGMKERLFKLCPAFTVFEIYSVEIHVIAVLYNTCGRSHSAFHSKTVHAAAISDWNAMTRPPRGDEFHVKGSNVFAMINQLFLAPFNSYVYNLNRAHRWKRGRKHNTDDCRIPPIEKATPDGPVTYAVPRLWCDGDGKTWRFFRWMSETDVSQSPLKPQLGSPVTTYSGGRAVE